ncbi:hypothetical protein Hdeb2414_s0032g00711411 [Helianthus debilis subsp. tardiflorus]
MAARASFSRDSRTVSMPLPNSILLKDYLVDDLSSCSSNGFRSYPRQPCCTKVRYLIEIDLSIKLPPSRKQFLKVNSKPNPKHNSNPNCSKSKMNLRFHKASKAVVNVFKKFHFSGSGSGNRTKPKPKPKHNFLHFWKQTRSMNRSIDSFERLNSFKRNDNINMNNNNLFTTLTTTATTAVVKASGSNSNSNSFTSSDSYFTATTNSGCSNIIIAPNDVVESEQLAPEKMNTEAVTVVTASNAKVRINSMLRITQ